MSMATFDTTAAGDQLYATPLPPRYEAAPRPPAVTPGERFLLRVMLLLILVGGSGTLGFKVGEHKGKVDRASIIVPAFRRCPFECRPCRRQEARETGEDEATSGEK